MQKLCAIDSRRDLLETETLIKVGGGGGREGMLLTKANLFCENLRGRGHSIISSTWNIQRIKNKARLVCNNRYSYY